MPAAPVQHGQSTAGEGLVGGQAPRKLSPAANSMTGEEYVESRAFTATSRRRWGSTPGSGCFDHDGWTSRPAVERKKPRDYRSVS